MYRMASRCEDIHKYAVKEEKFCDLCYRKSMVWYSNHFSWFLLHHILSIGKQGKESSSLISSSLPALHIHDIFVLMEHT